MRSRDSRLRGLTLLESVISLSVLGVFTATAVTALISTQRAMAQSQMTSVLALRAQKALERIVDLASQAVTSDLAYTPLKPATGVDSHALRFRLVQSVDVVTGEPVFDDVGRVYVYGSDSGSNPSSGILIGRGPTLDSIHAAAAGSDGLLGTTDDDTRVVLSSGVPAVELLVPSDFAPRVGAMLSIDVTPPPTGRLIELTIRLNARGVDGVFLLEDDIVLTERVALRQ